MEGRGFSGGAKAGGDEVLGEVECGFGGENGSDRFPGGRDAVADHPDAAHPGATHPCAQAAGFTHGVHHFPEEFLVVEHQQVPESHQFGHHPFDHPALGFQDEGALAPASREEGTGAPGHGIFFPGLECVVIGDDDASFADFRDEIRGGAGR